MSPAGDPAVLDVMGVAAAGAGRPDRPAAQPFHAEPPLRSPAVAGAGASLLLARTVSGDCKRKGASVAAVGGTSEATQMYLRTVLELEMAGIAPLRARLRERLQHSAPAISEAVSRLAHDGLLSMDEQDRHLVLTPEGREIADAVLRKHQLAEHLLTSLGDIDAATAHAEACNWEHVISDAVERRLIERLGEPPACPYTLSPAGAVAH